jgi:hypothetical protein
VVTPWSPRPDRKRHVCGRRLLPLHTTRVPRAPGGLAGVSRARNRRLVGHPMHSEPRDADGALGDVLGHVRTVETGFAFSAGVGSPASVGEWLEAGMPYLNCPNCRLTLYLRSAQPSSNPCPRCSARLGRRALPVCLRSAATPKKREHAARSGARHGHRDSARPLVATPGELGITHHGAGGRDRPLRAPAERVTAS